MNNEYIIRYQNNRVVQCNWFEDAELIAKHLSELYHYALLTDGIYTWAYKEGKLL